MTTKIHDSATCTAGFNGRPCDMCQFAREVEENRSKQPSEPPTTEKGDAGFLAPEAKNALSGDSTQSSPIPAPTFDREWQDAPRWATNYTEQQVAEWWFIRGHTYHTWQWWCVARVREYLRHAKGIDIAPLINDLESLTLDQVKPETQ